MKQFYEKLTALNRCWSHTRPRLTISKCLSLVISFWNKSVQIFFFKGSQPSLWDGLRVASVKFTNGIPNILNYCAVFNGVYTVYTYIYKIYIWGRGPHNNLACRMRPAGSVLKIHVLKRLSFRLLTNTLKITDKLQNISISIAEPWTWEQNAPPKHSYSLHHNKMPQPRRP